MKWFVNIFKTAGACIACGFSVECLTVTHSSFDTSLAIAVFGIGLNIFCATFVTEQETPKS